MSISSYQMHNVLNVFCRRFGKSGSGFESGAERDQNTEEHRRQARKRRQALIDKVVADIIEKVSRSGLEAKPAEPHARPVSIAGKPADEPTGRFVYHVLDERNRKVPREFSVEDSEFLLRRIEAVNSISEQKAG